MSRFILIIIGIILCSIGISVVIIYSNLLMYGYSFFEYIISLIRVIEFYYIFIGGFLIYKKR